VRTLLTGLAQISAVTAINLRSLGARMGPSVATVVGVAGVVMVFVGVLSIAAGFGRTIQSTGRPDVALVLRSGTEDEMSSGLLLEDTRIIAQAPGIAQGASGPLASAELFVIVDLPKRSTGTDANVPLRGVERGAFEVREEVRIVEGRAFEWGRNEIIVGQAAAAQFGGIELGTVTRWGEHEWTVVGVFSAGGTVEDSELWTDARVLQPAYRRGNTFQSVRVRLASVDAFEEFKDSLTTDPRLSVSVYQESEYYAGQSRVLIGIIEAVGYLIAFLMAVGAVFGALNTMYTAVSARTQEIATLRALGFGAGPVVISVLVESLLLASLGGLLGGVLAYGLFNGFQASTLNFQSFSQVAFAFAVTPDLLARGIGFALLMGTVGGLFPALHAARLPVATALREA
jgi:putative ABC transport system permease protein